MNNLIMKLQILNYTSTQTDQLRGMTNSKSLITVWNVERRYDNSPDTNRQDDKVCVSTSCWDSIHNM